MKKEYLNAQNEEDLVEIVKAVQNGEDPGERLKKKAEEEEAARKKAAQEEAAAREAAEKEKAEREAAQKEEAAEKRAARKQAAAERREQKQADEETSLSDEDDEEQEEGKTQRRYGANAVSDKAETVGNRILRSLHMEHLEEPPSDEAVEELIKDLPTEDHDESEDEPEKMTKEEETMTEIDETKAVTEEKSEEEGKEAPAEEGNEAPAEEEGNEAPAAEEEQDENLSKKEEETAAEKEEPEEQDVEESFKEMRSEAAEEIEKEPEEKAAEESIEKAAEKLDEEPAEGEKEEPAEEEIAEEPEKAKAVGTQKKTAKKSRTGMLIATGVIVVGMAALAVGSSVSSPGQNTKAQDLETEEAQAADLTDAEAPVLSAVNSGGMITLNASDEDSGVDTVWYAVVADGGLSNLPLYQVYEEPITYEEGNTYYFYAVDQAGNQSELISIPE